MPERARQPGSGMPAPPTHRAPSAPPLHGDRHGGPREGVFRPLELQSLAGNQAVGLVVDQIAQRALQRVAVKETPPDETLYNQPGTGGKGGAAKFGGDVAYDMARTGDAGIAVTVRIQFLHQLRNGVDPTSPGAPPGTPPLGTLLNDPTEIPVNDPDDRRKWCQDIVREQVKPWNGRLSLVGEEVNVFSKNTQKRLPVTFNSGLLEYPSYQRFTVRTAPAPLQG